MSDEEAKQSNESGEQREDAAEERKPARKKAAKKVVSRVRDAKSDSSDRKPKEAPVDQDHPEAAPKGKDQPKEIKTVVEDAPEKEAKGGKAGKGGKSGRGGRRATKSASPSRKAEPVNPEELAKRAWKIFQADIAEEGITLVDNATGRQLALRSFELARVFLEEKGRQMRLHAAGPEKAPAGKAPRKEANQKPETEEEPAAPEGTDDD